MSYTGYTGGKHSRTYGISPRKSRMIGDASNFIVFSDIWPPSRSFPLFRFQ